MPRYFIQLAYNGSNYHGWQVQPNAVSVQSVLEKALSLLLSEKIDVVGAGRTDTGVHASFYVAHIQPVKEISDLEHLLFKLNSFLPNDIRVDTIFEVQDDMHARFSATSRTYRYHLANRKEPFRQGFTSYNSRNIDVDAMNMACELLIQTSDFTSFSKLHTDVKTNLCNVTKAFWFYENDLLVFEISADRFLRNMVRAVVGTLLDVGLGKSTIDDFQLIIEAKNRGAAGASVPAHALFLTDISYPEPVNSQLQRKTIVF